MPDKEISFRSLLGFMDIVQVSKAQETTEYIDPSLRALHFLHQAQEAHDIYFDVGIDFGYGARIGNGYVYLNTEGVVKVFNEYAMVKSSKPNDNSLLDIVEPDSQWDADYLIRSLPTLEQHWFSAWAEWFIWQDKDMNKGN